MQVICEVHQSVNSLSKTSRLISKADGHCIKHRDCTGLMVIGVILKMFTFACVCVLFNSRM